LIIRNCTTGGVFPKLSERSTRLAIRHPRAVCHAFAQQAPINRLPNTDPTIVEKPPTAIVVQSLQRSTSRHVDDVRARPTGNGDKVPFVRTSAFQACGSSAISTRIPTNSRFVPALKRLMNSILSECRISSISVTFALYGVEPRTIVRVRRRSAGATFFLGLDDLPFGGLHIPREHLWGFVA
jgi:hypothetical protein